MVTKNIGALPMQIIRGLTQTNHIIASKEERLSPASLDLAITEEIYRIEELLLPHTDEQIRALLPDMRATRHTLDSPLQKGVTYIARLAESFALPRDVYAYCNPKSSTGRNDMHVRVMVNNTSRFDSLPPGYAGDAWVTITPNSFFIKMGAGETLSQIRFFTHDTRLSELELQIAMERDKLLWDKHGNQIHYHTITATDRDGSIILTADVAEEFVGWESIPSTNVLDLSKKWKHAPEDFFQPLYKSNGHIHLQQGRFYILRSREYLRVPPYLACEIAPMDERAGEFRSHYAGFFDPGWGLDKNGEGKGRPAVFEVRPLFQDLVLRDGQPIAKFRFEHLTRVPEKLYDEMNTSHYTNQSTHAILSKHFKIPQ
jgi:dCTP deaminase